MMSFYGEGSIWPRPSNKLAIVFQMSSFEFKTLGVSLSNVFDFCQKLQYAYIVLVDTSDII